MSLTFDIDQLESVLGKKEELLAIEKQTNQLERHLMVRASRCHMLSSRCFPNRRQPPTQLLTPAFNSPVVTNDPANVRPWRCHRGPEEEIPDSYAPRVRRPRVNFHFQKWRREIEGREREKEKERERERERSSRVSTNGHIYLRV